MPTEKRSDRASIAAPLRLLGRHERDLALDDAGGGLLALALRLGDAEVGQLHLALLADEHVVRADVAVDDAQRLAVAALAVRVGERAADLGDDVEAERGREDHRRRVGALEDLLEVPAVDQLQHQEVAPRRDAEVQHLHDVAVLEGHRDVSLVEEHVAELRIGRILREDALEDDRASRTPRRRAGWPGRSRPCRRRRACRGWCIGRATPSASAKVSSSDAQALRAPCGKIDPPGRCGAGRPPWCCRSTRRLLHDRRAAGRAQLGMAGGFLVCVRGWPSSSRATYTWSGWRSPGARSASATSATASWRTSGTSSASCSRPGSSSWSVGVLTRDAGDRGTIIFVLVDLTMVVFFNPVPELIYLGQGTRPLVRAPDGGGTVHLRALARVAGAERAHGGGAAGPDRASSSTGPLAMRLLMFQPLFSLRGAGEAMLTGFPCGWRRSCCCSSTGRWCSAACSFDRAHLPRPPPASMAVDKHKRKHPETDAFGIVADFHDAAGAAHTTSEETRAALKAAMGARSARARRPKTTAAHAVRVLVPGSDRQAGRPRRPGAGGRQPRTSSRASCRATCRSATTACYPQGRRRRATLADRQPGPLLPARRSAHLGLRGAGLRRALARRAGGSATSPTCARIGRFTQPRWAAAW